jgi:hypothetical protein
MHPTQPRSVVHSGVAPTIRARSALVRAMSALNRWENAYLSGRGQERVAAYQELMRAVRQAESDMAEATGRIGYQPGPMDDQLVVAAEAAALDDDLAAGDHYAGMPEPSGEPSRTDPARPFDGRTSGGHR